ncbi:uncharacterized protein [Watersipora subatra]|uniref:uncharacterized protein n=1 Tax=Watersipora subatra TaxID=2589382 RepID=UPI00355B9041
MPQKMKRHRPWSPSVVEQAHQNINRRLSEPVPRQTEGLSEEIKAKLAYITGEKPRQSPATLSQSRLSFDPSDDQELSLDLEATDTAVFEPTPPTTDPELGKVVRQRRRSEVLYNPATPKPSRKLSETTNRAPGPMLPPLQEKV